MVRWPPKKQSFSSCRKSTPGKSAQECANTAALENVKLEAVILMQTATSVGQALPVHSLQPFKQPEQQTRTTPRGKIGPNELFFGIDFPAIGVVQWWPCVASQMCPFGQAWHKWPEVVWPGSLCSAIIIAWKAYGIPYIISHFCTSFGPCKDHSWGPGTHSEE